MCSSGDCFRLFVFLALALGEFCSPGHQKNGALAHKLGIPVTFDNKFFGGFVTFLDKKLTSIQILGT
jgi:hypothetical protein